MSAARRPLAVLALVGLLALAPPPGRAQAEGFVGAWEGTYTASQGPTRVVVVVDAAEGAAFTGHFFFFADRHNLGVPTGLYEVRGEADAAAGEFWFVGANWIERPRGYVFVSFTGRADKPTGPIAGDVLFDDGTPVGVFTLRRLP